MQLPNELAARVILAWKPRPEIFAIWEAKQESDVILQILSWDLQDSMATRCLSCALGNGRFISARHLCERYPCLTSEKNLKSVVCRMYLNNTPPGHSTRSFVESYQKPPLSMKDLMLTVLRKILYFPYKIDRSLGEIISNIADLYHVEYTKGIPDFLRKQLCIRVMKECPDRFIEMCNKMRWFTDDKLDYGIRKIFNHYKWHPKVEGCILPTEAMKIIARSGCRLPRSSVYNPALTIEEIEDLRGSLPIENDRFIDMWLSRYELDKAIALDSFMCKSSRTLSNFIKIHDATKESGVFLETLRKLHDVGAKFNSFMIADLFTRHMTRTILALMNTRDPSLVDMIRAETNRRQVGIEMQETEAQKWTGYR